MGNCPCCKRDDAVPRMSMRVNTDNKPCIDSDPYDVNEHELGLFIEDKVNEQTAMRLIQKLKTKKNTKQTNHYNHNDTDDNVIKAQHCIYVLLFTCVLYLKYKERTEKRPEIQIDKKKLKKSLIPSYDWILENKLRADGTFTTSQFKMLGNWLKEFYVEKQKR